MRNVSKSDTRFIRTLAKCYANESPICDMNAASVAMSARRASFHKCKRAKKYKAKMFASFSDVQIGWIIISLLKIKVVVHIFRSGMCENGLVREVR